MQQNLINTWYGLSSRFHMFPLDGTSLRIIVCENWWWGENDKVTINPMAKSGF